MRSFVAIRPGMNSRHGVSEFSEIKSSCHFSEFHNENGQAIAWPFAYELLAGVRITVYGTDFLMGFSNHGHNGCKSGKAG